MNAIEQLEALPTSGLTVSVLQALDPVVPGAWSNATRFDDLIGELQPDAPAALVQQLRARAEQLAQEDRYARALTLYALVDRVDQVAAGAAVVSKVGDLFGSLGFLERFTPKPETTQAVDAALKLVAEMIAFGLLHGVPSTDAAGVARFSVALSDYGRHELMRIAAWVALDGLLPLGGSFVSILTDTLRSVASSDLASNAVFQQLGDSLPGEGPRDKQAFVIEVIEGAGDWINDFVAERGLSQEQLLSQLQGTLSVTEGGLDYVAAAIDASTAYFSHTGTQTVARALARHALESLQADVWRAHVASLG